MSPRLFNWGLSLTMAGILMLVSCTDKRKPPPKAVPAEIQATPPPETLVAVGDVTYEGQETRVHNMVRRGNAIHMIGKPFGYMKWDLSGNPEAPNKIFAVGSQIDLLFPRWIVDEVASSGLAVLGPYTLMTGMAGLSIIDTSETLRPREVARYPAYDPNKQLNDTIDEAFVWSEIIVNRYVPVVIGFRKNDYAVRAQFNNRKMQLLSKEYYAGPGETVCCVEGATVFHDKAFVAFRSQLKFYDFGADAVLRNERVFGSLQAVNVVSTDRYLYVQHEPNQSNAEAARHPAGIYVFDKAGKHVTTLQLSQLPITFTVSADDSHFYANIDDTAVRIFRIIWQN